MKMELIWEIYATQGKYLTNPPENLRQAVLDYLQLLEKAGKEIATDMKLSADTEKLLQQQGFISV